ncbi:MAG: Na(+)-translocating NADH-quinone reductase subunit A [Verrucomicrobia bacterium]|nr:Na(+)-translocating NADH-quinone reductase subunit A [Verrucomicrobiota bacterium]
MGSYKIKHGLDLRLMGSPKPSIADASDAGSVSIYPQEFEGIKPRLQVKEGDIVKRGGLLFFDKKNEHLKFRAPAGGRVNAIKLGPRRALTEIEIEVSPNEDVETFQQYTAEQILTLSRDEILSQLLETGYLAYILQRPFSKIADPAVSPKSIFVNGMNTAPFQADIHIAVTENETDFQAGLNILTRLTNGKVNLCIAANPANPSTAVTQAKHVDIHTFSGPHPSGNSSVHIHNIDPISPGDQVWVASAVDVILIGALFLEGVLPATKVVVAGGTGIQEPSRQYYRTRIGGRLDSLLKGRCSEEPYRLLSGDVLSGIQIQPDEYLRFYQSSITAIPASRKRSFLGWMSPGWNQFSASKLFLSSWFKRSASWDFNTNLNGSHRVMVLTGLYDKYMPMRIMVDYLVRAALAHDTDEAVKLGILETDPEDFALCSYVCPSKMDVMGIIRTGLIEIEEEGL